MKTESSIDGMPRKETDSSVEFIHVMVEADTSSIEHAHIHAAILELDERLTLTGALFKNLDDRLRELEKK